jgi:hypothetical protein
MFGPALTQQERKYPMNPGVRDSAPVYFRRRLTEYASCSNLLVPQRVSR